MSLSNLNKPNITLLPLIKLSDKKGKVVITPSFHNQIKYLCSKINTVEWSGILYHTSEGELENPETFVCKPQHILLMDKGTSGFTEYDFSSPLFMDGLHDKPELMSMIAGHIHSHHSMQSYFSGTDVEELTENAVNYNYYLSLIVNNKNQYVARVAFPGINEGRIISYINNKGKKVSIKMEDSNVVFYYEMDIVIEEKSFVDKIKDKFFKKYNRILGTQNTDALDVLEVVQEKDVDAIEVEKCFEEQYNRVIASKPVVTYQNDWQSKYNEDFVNNQTVMDFGKKNKKNKFSSKETQDLTLRIAALKYIKNLCNAAEVGVDFFEHMESNEALQTFLTIRNGWISTRNFGDDVANLIQNDVDFNVFCDKFLTILELDDHTDFTKVDIGDINSTSIAILQEAGFKDYALSKILITNLSQWTWK
jgi:hypothetical protein